MKETPSFSARFAASTTLLLMTVFVGPAAVASRLALGFLKGGALNLGSFSAPAGGWNLSNYLTGNQSLGPYPAPTAAAAYDYLPADTPGWKQTLIADASIFQPLPNRGCPPGVPVDCVDYESNGGLYPNCDPRTYGFSCGLPIAKACLTSSQSGRATVDAAAYTAYNLTFVPHPDKPWNRYGAPASGARFELRTPTAAAWAAAWAGSPPCPPTEIVFPIRWTDLQQKVVSVPQTALIRSQINAMNGRERGEWLMKPIPENNALNVSYAWLLDGAPQLTFMKYLTPSSVTHPDPRNYGKHLYGLVLKLPPSVAPDGRRYTVDIPLYAWILVWNTLPNVDYSFGNGDDTYCTVQTAALGPHCLATGPGLACYVTDLPEGTAYCRAAEGTRAVTCYSSN